MRLSAVRLNGKRSGRGDREIIWSRLSKRKGARITKAIQPRGHVFIQKCGFQVTQCESLQNIAAFENLLESYVCEHV